MTKGVKIRLTELLSKRPSYFRWSNKRLAERIGCKSITVKNIKNKLKEIAASYEARIKS